MAYLVQPADIELAVAWWRQRADEMWLGAENDDIYSSGTAYTETRDELDKVLLVARGEFARNAEDLLAGVITFAAWSLITKVQIRIVHIVGAALAVGGFKVLRDAISGQPVGASAPAGTGKPAPDSKPAGVVSSIIKKIGDAISREYKFFERFAKQAQTGKNTPARAGMYAEAGRGTFEDVRSDVAKAAGNTEERRVLGVADHCSDCVVEAAKGWQPIGSLRAIGDSLCKTHCHCKKEFR